jgi:hypothetical protein
MKDIGYFHRHMEELKEVTIQGNKHPKIFCAKDCGGPPFTRTLRNFVRILMFVIELGIHPGEMIFLWYRK